MKPVMHVDLKRTEMMCVDWSPHDPNLLLTGAADGKSGVGWGGAGRLWSEGRGRVGGDGGEGDGAGVICRYGCRPACLPP